MEHPRGGDENPYAAPRADPARVPDAATKKTGFTIFQGLAIITIATVLFSYAHYYQQSRRIARARAAVQRIHERERLSREKNAPTPPVTPDPMR